MFTNVELLGVHKTGREKWQVQIAAFFFELLIWFGDAPYELPW